MDAFRPPMRPVARSQSSSRSRSRTWMGDLLVNVLLAGVVIVLLVVVAAGFGLLPPRSPWSHVLHFSDATPSLSRGTPDLFLTPTPSQSPVTPTVIPAMLTPVPHAEPLLTFACSEAILHPKQRIPAAPCYLAPGTIMTAHDQAGIYHCSLVIPVEGYLIGFYPARCWVEEPGITCVDFTGTHGETVLLGNYQVTVASQADPAPCGG